MPQYTPTTWVNGVTPANATNLNKIETQLQAAPYSTFFATPYQLINNVTINSGTTNTYTCTGVGGVPSSATAVLLQGYFYPGTAGMQLNFAPSGSLGTNGYPQKVAPTSTYAYDFQFILPLNASGKLDVKPTGGNAVVYMWMYGYIY